MSKPLKKKQKEDNLEKLSKTPGVKIMFEKLKKTLEPVTKFQEKLKKSIFPLTNLKGQFEKQSRELEKLRKERIRRKAEHENQAFIQTKQNRKMLEFTSKGIKLSQNNLKLAKVYLFIAILTLAVIVGISVYENHEEKMKQIEILGTQVDNLDLELHAHYLSIDDIYNKVGKGVLRGKVPIDNLKAILLNGNLRNNTIKAKSFTLLFNLNQIYSTVERLNLLTQEETRLELSNQIKEIIINKKINENILELRKLLFTYKECIKEKGNFNVC